MLFGTIISFRQNPNESVSKRYLFLLFASSFILELLADIQMVVFHKNNLFYYHLMTICHFIYFSMYFSQRNKNKLIFIWAVVFVVLAELIMVISGLQTVKHSPSYIRLICKTLLLLYVLDFLNGLIKLDSLFHIELLPEFWVSMSILIYFCNFIILGFLKYLISKDINFALFWYEISIWFDMAFYSTLIYSLFKKNEITFNKF